jgi:CheY-like chemotaxis protein
LLAHVEQYAGSNRPAGITADDLAQRLGISASEARVIASELARSGCIRIGRMPNGRARNGGRYAQSVALPASGEQCGVSRQPRMRPVGLVIEADTVQAEQLGRMLREEGVVPVAVATTSAALMLLRSWGFELLLLDCTTRQHPLSASELSQMQKLTREARCGPLLVLGGTDDLRAAMDQAGNGYPRIRLVGRDREHARTAVVQVLRGSVGALPGGPTLAFG